MVAGKVRFGRPVLSATLRAETKFDVTKKAVQVNLLSADASGKPVYARYYWNLADAEAANSFAALAKSCTPAA